MISVGPCVARVKINEGVKYHIELFTFDEGVKYHIELFTLSFKFLSNLSCVFNFPMTVGILPVRFNPNFLAISINR